jgi:hypothetical protein
VRYGERVKETVKSLGGGVRIPEGTGTGNREEGRGFLVANDLNMSFSTSR